MVEFFIINLCCPIPNPNNYLPSPHSNRRNLAGNHGPRSFCNVVMEKTFECPSPMSLVRNRRSLDQFVKAAEKLKTLQTDWWEEVVQEGGCWLLSKG